MHESKNKTMIKNTKSSLRWATAAMLLLFFLPISTKAASNETEAKNMFNKAWKMFTSPNGVSLSYSVNIIGLYKTAGTIWLKGNKQHYQEKRYIGWSDATHFYKVDTKKKTVDFHNPKSPKRDKYLSKFTFSPNDYNYSLTSEKKGYVIHLDAKDDVKSSVKHAKLVLDRQTYYPTAMKIKVAFFWTTVKISNFHPGIANDNVFVFPTAKYKSYKFTNHWPD